MNLDRASVPAKAANTNFGRMIRTYRFMRDNDGWVDRDQIMHWTGHRRPLDAPVVAYVEFAHTLMRLNRILAKSNRKIVGGIVTGERYRMETVE